MTGVLPHPPPPCTEHLSFLVFQKISTVRSCQQLSWGCGRPFCIHLRQEWTSSQATFTLSYPHPVTLGSVHKELHCHSLWEIPLRLASPPQILLGSCPRAHSGGCLHTSIVLPCSLQCLPAQSKYTVKIKFLFHRKSKPYIEFLKSLYIPRLQDASASKAVGCQAWWPMVYPQDPLV